MKTYNITSFEFPSIYISQLLNGETQFDFVGINLKYFFYNAKFFLYFFLANISSHFDKNENDATLELFFNELSV